MQSLAGSFAVLLLLLVTFITTGSVAHPADNAKKVKAPCMGIDFGHDSFAVGIWQDGDAKLIPDENGHLVLPTSIFFDGLKSDSYVLGHDAVKMINNKPEAGAKEIHHLLGRNSQDEVIEELQKKVPYTINVGEDKGLKTLKVAFDTDGGVISSTAEQIAAYFLINAKKRVEKFLRRKVVNTVIALPAGFGGGVRQAFTDAAVMAGVKIVRFINEPTAAMIAYGLQRIPGERYVVTIHLGNEELSVSVATSGNGFTEVVKTVTDDSISAHKIANKTAFTIGKLLKKQFGIRVFPLPEELRKIATAVHRSTNDVYLKGEAEISVPEIRDNFDLKYTLKRKSFEGVNKDSWNGVVGVVKRVLKEAKVDVSRIDEYILLGGLTKSPALRKNVKEFFNGKDANKGMNPDHVVAIGATVQGAILTGQQEKALGKR